MATTDCLELETFSSNGITTPLLFADHLEDTPIEHDQQKQKFRVIIENAPASENSHKNISTVATKWEMKYGILLWTNMNISNEWGHAAYQVTTSGCFLIDMAIKDVRFGNQVAQLKQSCSFRPTFNIYLHGSATKFATIKLKFSLLSMKAKVTFDNGEPDLDIRGSFFAFQ